MSFRPGVINDAIVSLNGEGEMIGIVKVTPPEITFKTEEIVGLGLSSYEEVIDGLVDTMTTNVGFSGLSKSISFGKGKSFNLIVTAAIQGTDDEDGTTKYQKIVHTIRGKVKSIKSGELSRGGKVEPEVEIATTYYKHEIDGKTITEIDVFSRKTVIDGEDIRSEINNILGV